MAVTENNNNTDVYIQNGSSISTSMTVTAGHSNLCAVVRIICSNLQSGTFAISGNVTYGGVNMTAAGAVQNDNETHPGGAVIYTLVAPATGSNILAFSITPGSVNQLLCDLTSYYNVNQSTPVRAGSYTTLDQTSSSTTISRVITSAVGDMTTSCTYDGSTMAAGVINTNQTQLNLDNSGFTGYGSDQAAGAATVTDTWTYNNTSNDLVMVAMSIQQTGGGGGGVSVGYLV